MVSNISNRLVWADALRAFLALGVVLSHAHTCFPNSGFSFDFLTPVLILFRIDVFFFLSGFFFMRSADYFTVERSKAKTLFVLRRLVIPAILFFLLSNDIDSWWPVLSKGMVSANYFLVALAEIIIINQFLATIVAPNPKKILGTICFSCFFSLFICTVFSGEGSSILHWKQAVYGNIFFCLGAIASYFKDEFQKIVSSTPVICALIILTTLLEVYDFSIGHGTSHRFVHLLAHRLLLPTIGTLCLFGIFMRMSDLMVRSSSFCKLSSYLGQRTIATYLISWCIFYLITPLIELFGIEKNIISLTVVFLLGTLGSLAAHDIIYISPKIGYYLFGKKASSFV